MRNNIRIYEVKSEYIKYLSNYQAHIFAQADGKDKHKLMKEGVDFIKIKDYAVINLNNMIPVPDSQIVNIDINKEKNQGCHIDITSLVSVAIGLRYLQNA